MSGPRNAYEILGIKEDVDFEELEKISNQKEPELEEKFKNGTATEEDKKINNALCQIAISPARRQKYDEKLFLERHELLPKEKYFADADLKPFTLFQGSEYKKADPYKVLGLMPCAPLDVKRVDEKTAYYKKEIDELERQCNKIDQDIKDFDAEVKEESKKPIEQFEEEKAELARQKQPILKQWNYVKREIAEITRAAVFLQNPKSKKEYDDKYYAEWLTTRFGKNALPQYVYIVLNNISVTPNTLSTGESKSHLAKRITDMVSFDFQSLADPSKKLGIYGEGIFASAEDAREILSGKRFLRTEPTLIVKVPFKDPTKQEKFTSKDVLEEIPFELGPKYKL